MDICLDDHSENTGLIKQHPLLLGLPNISIINTQGAGGSGNDI